MKARLEELKPSLPTGVEIVTTYDRSDLIERAIDTLRHELTIEMIIVSLVILVFLWHIPSAIVPIVTIPVSVLLAFIPMYFLGVTVNIMSLAGIAISIGVLVDGAIVEVENAYNKLYLWQAGGRKGDFHAVRLEALKEVGPSVFFSLLVIAVAFLPVFVLVDQEGRLFKPLAYTKNLAMAIAAVLAITLDPAMRMLFTRMDPFTFRPRWLSWLATKALVGTYHSEERHPISRAIFAVYDPACRLVLRYPKTVIALAVAAVLATVPVYLRLGSEFMPNLNEGVILYMPTTHARDLGGAGRGTAADTGPGAAVVPGGRTRDGKGRARGDVHRPRAALDDGDDGRPQAGSPSGGTSTGGIRRQPLPEWFKTWARSVWPDHISQADLVDQMDGALQIPGQTNAWTMPIKGRIDMLTTGVRTPVGVKVFGQDLAEIQRIGEEIERLVRPIPGTRSVFAERVTGGHFVDFTPRRDQLARYGLTIEQVQEVIMTAVGGENITTTIEGRERYPVNVRYPRELRDDIDRLQPRPGSGCGRRADSARRARRHPVRRRTVDDPRRERLHGRLRLRRHRRARRRQLRRGGQAGRSRSTSGCRKATCFSGAASTRT